jgi:hypothetical protein
MHSGAKAALNTFYGNLGEALKVARLALFVAIAVVTVKLTRVARKAANQALPPA